MGVFFIRPWVSRPRSLALVPLMRAGVLDGLIALYLIVQWVAISSALILYNKHLISGGFGHPVTLVLLHMMFGSFASGLWSAMGWEQVPSISFRSWAFGFLPVGMFFAASLAFSNMAYLYISVAYIQMIKASTPVVVLLLSFCFGVEKPSLRLAAYIVLISTGVTISCFAQLEPSIAGTLIQIVALVCEGMRLCLINLLLTSKGLKLSAISNLYYIAPTCFLCLLGPWCLLEAPVVLANGGAALRQTGALALISNSSVAFLLNLATLALIKHTSALTLNVAGVVKDLLLIVWSVVMHGAIVTRTQYMGYSIAFCGVSGYSAYKQSLARQEAAAKQEAEKQQLLQDEMDVEDGEDEEELSSGQ